MLVERDFSESIESGKRLRRLLPAIPDSDALFFVMYAVMRGCRTIVGIAASTGDELFGCGCPLCWPPSTMISGFVCQNLAVEHEASEDVVTFGRSSIPKLQRMNSPSFAFSRVFRVSDAEDPTAQFVEAMCLEYIVSRELATGKRDSLMIICNRTMQLLWKVAQSVVGSDLANCCVLRVEKNKVDGVVIQFNAHTRESTNQKHCNWRVRGSFRVLLVDPTACPFLTSLLIDGPVAGKELDVASPTAAFSGDTALHEILLEANRTTALAVVKRSDNNLDAAEDVIEFLCHLEAARAKQFNSALVI